MQLKQIHVRCLIKLAYEKTFIVQVQNRLKLEI